MKNWLFDGLLPASRNNHHALFLSGPDIGKTTYLQLQQKTAQCAHTLLSLGLRPNDRVVVQIEKSIDSLVLYLATVRAGGIFIPLNTAYVTTEVDDFITDASPAIFITDPAKEEAFRKIFLTRKIQLFTLDAAGKGSWSQLCVTQSTKFENISRTADDLAAILYTSGTTGRSKGVMLTHDNLLSNAKALQSCWQYQSTDVLLHALPVYHTHGLFVALNITLVAGASMFYLKRFDSDLICQYLPTSTVMMGVPTFYTRLIANGNLTAKVCRNMRLFISGSAPLLTQDHEQFESLTGHVILERYGMTETNMLTSNPYLGDRKAGTVGLPLPDVQLRIVSQQSGEVMKKGETGMIQVKGPNVFAGYWNMPDKTAEEFSEDGFFITGDLGREDTQGYLSIVGRDKDLIISGGLNIYPKDVEQVINDCRCVLESAVIGIVDADFGEVAVAVIVLQDSAIDENRTTEEDASKSIKAAVQKNLAGYKRPKQLFFIDELPRNTMGKIQKNRLREMYGQSVNRKK